ncbi:hypothetical protein OB13_20025 [Pontibacter sp. HJ8]
MKVLKERLEEVITLIAEVANGNFDYKIEASETGDEMDALIEGISMLGQELKSSTVSRDFMQSIYQGVVDMLLILNTDFTIRNVNESLEEALGYSESELQGLPLSNLVHPDYAFALLTLAEDCKVKGKCLNKELLLTTRRKQEIPVSCSFSYLRNNRKEIDGILVIAKDVTEFKKTEKALRKAKRKADTANEAKSSFLSSMSHEIRTPLNGIIGFTDLLLETELNKTQLQYINLIKTSGNTLNKLLNDILDLHRVEQNKIHLETIPYNIRESVAANLESYRFLAESKGLVFSLHFEDSIPEWAIGDPTRFNQIMTNLVSNAIKFTEEGQVDVHFRAEQEEDNGLLLTGSVTDTGIGIAKDKQAIVFKSFTQSDQSTSRRYGGSGLGLAISKNLAKLMRGDIQVISPPPGRKKGAMFVFTARLKRLHHEEPAHQASSDETAFMLQENTQILVVDDNEINVMLLQAVLENFGAVVTPAYTGQQAVDIAASKSFQLVFMDIQMPGMDGLEAASLLRKANFSAPIIAFSANAYSSDIQKSLAAGMQDHLCKPFEQSDLVNALKKWL